MTTKTLKTLEGFDYATLDRSEAADARRFRFMCEFATDNELSDGVADQLGFVCPEPMNADEMRASIDIVMEHNAIVVTP